MEWTTANAVEIETRAENETRASTLRFTSHSQINVQTNRHTGLIQLSENPPMTTHPAWWSTPGYTTQPRTTPKP